MGAGGKRMKTVKLTKEWQKFSAQLKDVPEDKNFVLALAIRGDVDIDDVCYRNGRVKII